MYGGRVACCALGSHGEHADWTDRQTDRWTDARLLHYAFHCRHGPRNIVVASTTRGIVVNLLEFSPHCFDGVDWATVIRIVKKLLH